MGWEIPIFRISVNGNPRVLAYLRPIASEGFVDELVYIYELVNSSLIEYFKAEKLEYKPEELRLCFLSQQVDSYQLWQPPKLGSQENIHFIYSFGIHNLPRVTAIEVPHIPENFPHIFWEKSEETTNIQQD